MKKILWFSSVNELDYEMQMLFDRMPDYDFRMAVPSAGNDYFFPVPIRLDHTSIVTKEQMVALLRDYQPDLLIHRYRRDHVPILEAAEETGVPVLIWVTEQGPDRDIEWDRNQYFRNLAANNPWDVDYFKSRGVENVYYWPFGFLPFFHCPVEPDEKYRCDFVGYGNPIYNWYDCKRESVDNVVVPLVKNGYDVSLWGRRSGESGGWLDVPGVIDGKHYKGTFNYDDLSKVNASAKVILGITSNGRYGAFGSRLARALGSKAFCIWAYSEGMEEMSEGFANHRNCCWSTHPDETLEIADFYLKNDAARLRVAEAGQKMAFEKLNYFDMVPPIIEDMIGKQPRRAHSRYYALSRAIGKAIAERQPQRVLECGYQILADDVTSLNYAMALDMAESFLELRKYRLCLEYLRIFRDKYAAWERRLGRSAQRFPVDSRIDALLRRIIQVIGDRLDEGTGGEDWDELRHLLIGVLGIHSGGDLAGPLFTQLARYMVTASYRDGNGATALQAFNIYLALLEDSKHERNNALAISRGLLACFPRGNGKKRAAAAPVDLISQWELLVRVSSHLDLLRANLLVGGDILPGQPELLAHNVGPTTWLRRADGPTLHRGDWAEIPDVRRAVTVIDTIDALQDAPDAPDALVYVAAGNDESLEVLAERCAPGACLVLVAPHGSPLAAKLDAQRVWRAAWRQEWVGGADFGMAPGHALSGRIEARCWWKQRAPLERLEDLAVRLSDRLEPRICQVTLDPLEILLGLYAWSEGYARVMQEVCAREGVAARVRSLRAGPPPGGKFASEREHTVLEVEIDGLWTTWDPLLGLGYLSSVDELIANPAAAAEIIGRRDGKHWAKYGLARFAGEEFWSAVTQQAHREDLEQPPVWQECPARVRGIV